MEQGSGRPLDSRITFFMEQARLGDRFKVAEFARAGGEADQLQQQVHMQGVPGQIKNVHRVELYKGCCFNIFVFSRNIYIFTCYNSPELLMNSCFTPLLRLYLPAQVTSIPLWLLPT